MDIQERPNTHARSGVDRRTVLRATAWSAPGVVLLGTTPAFAQSPANNQQGIASTSEQGAATTTSTNSNADLYGSSSFTLTRASGGQQVSFSWTVFNPAGNSNISNVSMTLSGLSGPTLSTGQITSGSSHLFSVEAKSNGSGESLDAFSISVSYTIGDQKKSHTWTVAPGTLPAGGTATMTLSGGVAGGTYSASNIQEPHTTSESESDNEENDTSVEPSSGGESPSAEPEGPSSPKPTAPSEAETETEAETDSQSDDGND